MRKPFRTKLISLRVINNQYYPNKVIELETTVLEINVDDSQGKEITLNIQTGINNQFEFFTDSNGLELQRRKVNYRATWDLV